MTGPATTSIPQLPVGITLTGTEIFPAVQNGVDKQFNASTMLQFFGGTAARIQVGVTKVVSGNNGSLLYDNNGTLGEYATVPVAFGGTGLSSYSVGDLLVASGATTLTRLSDVSSGSVLASGGVGAVPKYVSAVSAAALLSLAYVAPNISALRALPFAPPQAVTQGYNVAGDGGGGPPWEWNATATIADDGFMTVKLAAFATGRYQRQLQAGGAVSPLWAGCGLGASDDTAAFAKVVAFGSPIDMTNCTVPLGSLTITSSTTCPGIFSNGSGQFTNAASNTSATIVFNVTKSDFYFRNLFFNGPYTGDTINPPATNRMVQMETGISSVSAARWEVSGCRFFGCKYGLVISYPSNDVRVFNNQFDNIWGEALLLDSPRDSWTYNNVARNCAFDSTGNASAGFRINTSTINVVPQRLYFLNNTAYQCGLNNLQEGFDFAGPELYETIIAGNQAIECGNGGFELKPFDSIATFTATIVGTALTVSSVNGTIRIGQTISAASILPNTVIVSGSGLNWVVNNSQALGPEGMSAVLQPDTYGTGIISNNLVKMGGAATQGAGISMHTTSTPPPSSKGSKWLVDSNFVLLDTMVSAPGAATYNGIAVSGWSDVTISNNKLLNLNRGVTIDAVNTSDATQNNCQILNNTMNVAQYGVIIGGAATDMVNNTRIIGNMIVGGTNAIIAAGAICNGFYVGHNRLEATAGVAVECRNVVSGQVVFNTLIGTTNAAIQQGTTATVTYANNHVIAGAGSDAFLISIGSAQVVNNFIQQARLSYSGAGAVGANNVRGTASVNPTGSQPGALGDVFFNSNPKAGSINPWTCVTAGVVGVAVYVNA